jgi:hypothetical protein
MDKSAAPESHSPDSSGWKPNPRKRRLRPATRNRILLWCGFALTFTVLGSVAVWKMYAMGQQVSCGVNLSHAWHIVTSMYSSDDPDKEYPPMSPDPGQLFMSFNDVFPTYGEDNLHDYFCPAADRTFKGLSLEDKFSDSTYVYLGYALQNEDELLAFLDAYPEFIEQGADFKNDLPAPIGRGSFSGDTFVRLNQSHRPDGAADTILIPMLMEIPNYTNHRMRFRHQKPGGYVSFLGGGATFVPYGEEFPMTPALIEKIGEIKALYSE